MEAVSRPVVAAPLPDRARLAQLIAAYENYFLVRLTKSEIIVLVAARLATSVERKAFDDDLKAHPNEVRSIAARILARLDLQREIDGREDISGIRPAPVQVKSQSTLPPPSTPQRPPQPMPGPIPIEYKSKGIASGAGLYSFVRSI